MYYSKWYSTTTRIKFTVTTTATATSRNFHHRWFFFKSSERTNRSIDSSYAVRHHHHQHNYHLGGRYSLVAAPIFHPSPLRLIPLYIDPHPISGTRFLSSSSKQDDPDQYHQSQRQSWRSTNSTIENTTSTSNNYNYHQYNFDPVNNNNYHIMPRRKKQAPNDSHTGIDTTPTPVKATQPKFSKQYTDPETGMIIIEEGSCSMCIEATEMNDVFYNPVQVQNRDLSILMLQLYQERRQEMLKEQVDKFLIQHQKVLSSQQQEEEEKRLQSQQQPQEQEQVMVGGTAVDNNDQHMNSNEVDNSTDINPTTDVPTLANIDDTNTITGNIDQSTTTGDDDIVVDVPKVKLQVLDALAASGLRSLRYWKECSDIIDHLTINDIDPVAAQRALRNIERNQLSDQLIPDTQPHGRPHGIRITTSDASDILYNSRTKRQKRPNVLPLFAKLHVCNKIGSTPPIDDVALTPEEESHLNWDVIDLDPYGSSSTFIDAAVQAITHGGLLNVTCTDMRAMSGSNSPDTAFLRYGALPIKGSQYFLDYAIRMILHAIASAAGRYGRTIKPILSVGMDFYIRIFVEIYDDKVGTRALPLQTGMVFQSTQCPSFYTLPLAQMGGDNKKTCQSARIRSGVCTETGTPLKMGGPIWLGPLHDSEVLQKAIQRLEQKRFPNTNRTTGTSHLGDKQESLSSSSSLSTTEFIATRERLHGLLTSCLEELPDVPLYYVSDDIAKSLHINMPPLFEFKSAIVNAGYRVSGYHKEPRAIKTDAPSNVIWDIIRAWLKRRPLLKPPLPGSVAEKILSIEPSIDVDFNRPMIIYQTKEIYANTKRFPGNPERNWGPKPKAEHGKKRKSAHDE